MALADGTLDLAAALGGREHGQQAFMFAELDMDSDGEVVFGAGCDFWRRWWIDGKLVLGNLASGNCVRPITSSDHCFRRQLEAGRYLLAVQVIAGSASWVFSAGVPTPQEQAASALSLSDANKWAISPDQNQLRAPDSHNAGSSETTSAQLPDGKIVAVARPYRSPFMWQTESTDGGVNWDAGTLLDHDCWFNGSLTEAQPDVILVFYFNPSSDGVTPSRPRMQRIRITPNGPAPLA